ncbi:class I SAM-dependent methyltransferase [Clostridium butyricum]|uniref:Methyltransferase type 11 n=2 Tax=Clostridium butyricum TaxID=1492 RepID=C4IDN2_CLOBU|nr:class I SAM-dependent methyltransferase [Clostridium butyricum]APF24538.1 methyltransferase small domain protein [Clostridium butyricum]EDT75214.1 methyltransferase type 11 [Clostridium butyricum 5521]EEP55657.1 methyltransferase type 11 [Clostridium butyricum E4 str. BoNT E BL5262]KHD15800.1 methyltransferase type 11 [Clostridium butyricum]NFL31540.1 methyltransferase domain-containing protein [Clostridium butyricum]
MINNRKDIWGNLHSQSKFRPKYPSEIVVQYVFRNFKRDGKTKILDLGCGAGRHVFFMANENINTYGVDISKEGVEYTNEVLRKLKLKGTIVEGIISKLPYESNFFDGLISCGVLYYCTMDEIKKSVKEIYRVLKNNGKALIVVRTTEDYRYGNGEEVEKNTFIINEKDEDKCAFNENGLIMHFFTKDEIEKLFKEFKSVTIDKIEETSCNGRFKDSNFLIKLEK